MANVREQEGCKQHREFAAQKESHNASMKPPLHEHLVGTQPILSFPFRRDFDAGPWLRAIC